VPDSDQSRDGGEAGDTRLRRAVSGKLLFPETAEEETTPEPVG